MTWMEQAACADSREAQHLMFAQDPVLQRQAVQKWCVSCPVIEPCLAYALKTRMDDGVYGGLDEWSRRELGRRRINRRRRTA